MQTLTSKQVLETSESLAQRFRDQYADHLVRKMVSLRCTAWLWFNTDNAQPRRLKVRDVKLKIANWLRSENITPRASLVHRVYLWALGLAPNFPNTELQRWHWFQSVRKPAQKQLDTLRQIGYTGAVPETMLDASRMLSLVQSVEGGASR